MPKCLRRVSGQLVQVWLLTVWGACDVNEAPGGDAGQVSDTTLDAISVSSLMMLPTCSAETEGRLVYVRDSRKLMTCVEDEWVLWISRLAWMPGSWACKVKRGPRDRWVCPEMRERRGRLGLREMRAAGSDWRTGPARASERRRCARRHGRTR